MATISTEFKAYKHFFLAHIIFYLEDIQWLMPVEWVCLSIKYSPSLYNNAGVQQGAVPASFPYSLNTDAPCLVTADC